MLWHFNIEVQYMLKYLQTVPKHVKIAENGGWCADLITDTTVTTKQIYTWQIYHLIFKSTP